MSRHVTVKERPAKHAHTRAERKQECWYKHLDLPADIALYYGFIPTETPVISKEDIKRARAICEPELRGRETSDQLARFVLEEKVALLRLYMEKKMEALPQPATLYIGSPISEEGITYKTAPKERTVYLEIMGAQRSTAEALLIKTTLEILKEEGYSNLLVHINSVGDRETIQKFSRELAAYYRKNIENLPAHCRQLMKHDIFDLLSCRNEKCRIIKDNAPKSVGFLSEPSRLHFKEVLEYLETLGISYEIDHFLVGSRSFACQTIFEIHTAESREACKPLAVGVRYGNIARKLGWKRDVPGIGARLTFKEKNCAHNLRFLKPKIYFVQLGFEAKLKSLKIIEILRQAGIPVYQAISRDKLISQLSVAENMKIPYTIIMGQKEALEDTVIVRDMNDRAQETVKIADLPKYLKKL